MKKGLIFAGLVSLGSAAAVSDSQSVPKTMPANVQSLVSVVSAGITTKTTDFALSMKELKKDYDLLAQLETNLQHLESQLQFMQFGSNKEQMEKYMEYWKGLKENHARVQEKFEKGRDDLFSAVERWFSENPEDHKENKLILADLLAMKGESQKHLDLLLSLKKKGHLDENRLLELGEVLFEKNLIERGILEFEAIASKKWQDTSVKDKANVFLAQGYFWLQNYEKSLQVFQVLFQDPQWKTKLSRFHEMVVQSEKNWKNELEFRKADKNLPRVKIQTSKGEVVVELFEDDAPNAVANFIALAESGFYKDQKFHRVLPNFMAQAGDPNSKDEDATNDGAGNPGYRIATEISKRKHFRGVISYANSGVDTDGSQFFLTVVPTPWLDGKHAVFGRIVSGQEVVDSLEAQDKLVDVKVLSKREHKYEVKKK